MSEITVEQAKSAAKLLGLEFSDAELELALNTLRGNLSLYRAMREVALDNAVPPAIRFSPIPPGMMFDADRREMKPSKIEPIARPKSDEDIAFLPVTHLSHLIRTRQITSYELTRLYLSRLEKHGDTLECVVTRTEELAQDQARRADEEIASGNYRGPLHGVPWGAKDLLATKGYKTTWGAPPYKEQTIDDDATVVRKLADAGAVLVAKLTMGSLAWGDVWFGGKTRNPWDIERGSSGSSAGSAAAVAAGLVGFAIGTETQGSIVSPCTECGVTGLRPTFGRVSRHGAMALSWTMDKIGPICRSVEDCALIFDAIHGPDGKDSTVVDLPFNYDAGFDATSLRVGFVESAFEKGREDDEEWAANDRAMLDALRNLGVELTPIELPDLGAAPLSLILNVEAAAAFDELTRSDRDDLLVRQTETAWPNIFRAMRFVSAVEYIQAQRHRTLLMDRMAALFDHLDAYVVPTWVGPNPLITNLTGHPATVLPNGYRSENGRPTSATFIGNLYGEETLLSLAKAYQDATDFHLRRPPSFDCP